MPSEHDGSLAGLDRRELAVLAPEYLLCGHLIDRAGMPHVIGAFGRDGMVGVAVDEWQWASPHYTRRMQRALGYEGDDLVTIFKGLQLDVGAPPQFLDFRFEVESPLVGYFELATCGALLDVERMGDAYVTAMCVDVEDPTMDATALATNPRARMHPIHRPPRRADATGAVCRWRVDIDEARDPIQWPEETLAMARSEAVGLTAVSPVDPDDDGAADYAGALVSDLDFAAFSRSALVRICQEVALQWHLLAITGRRAVLSRSDVSLADEIARKQAVGVAGITGERLARALGYGADQAGDLLAIHPTFQPHGYTGVTVENGVVRVPRDSPAVRDGGWYADVRTVLPAVVEAAVHPLNASLHAVVTETDAALEIRLVPGEPRTEADEVALVRFSQGAAFAFEPRRSLPLYVAT